MTTLSTTLSEESPPTIIFDRPSKNPAIKVTVGKDYPSRWVNFENRLVVLNDDYGIEFMVSLYGRSLTNGRNWHLKEDEPYLKEHCDD